MLARHARKGYPEFDPDQPRDEGGRFSGGRGAKLERARVKGFDTSTVWYHGTGRVFDEFDPSAPKVTGGGLNRWGSFISRDPKVASRYAMSFGGDSPNVIPVFTRTSKVLELTAGQYERLQSIAGKIDRGQEVDEVQGVFLSVDLEDKGVKWEPGTGHPVQAIVDAGFDAIDKDAGRFGTAESERLVFKPRKNLRSVNADYLSDEPGLMKGYPEFDPSQPRNEDGTWGGTGKMGSWKTKEGVQARFPGTAVEFERDALSGGTRIFVAEGGYDGLLLRVSYYPAAKQVNLGLIEAADTRAGRESARKALAFVLDMAEESGAESIFLSAGLESGGYVWPRIGFEAFDAWDLKDDYVTRLDEAKGKGLPQELYDKAMSVMDNTHPMREMPSAVAQLDDPVPLDVFEASVGQIRTAGALKPTLGKLILLAQGGSYELPRAKYSLLRNWVSRPFSKRMRKGYPEFDPNQARNEDGTWGSGGGRSAGKFDHRKLTQTELRDALSERMNEHGATVTVRGVYPNEYQMRVEGNGVTYGIFNIRDAGETLDAGFMGVSDDGGGRRLASAMMRMVRDLAAASGMKQITTQAGLEMGGYTWPRLGFNLVMDDLGNELAMTVQRRARLLFDRGLITQAEFSDIDSLAIYEWDETGPTRVSKRDRPMKLDRAQLFTLSNTGIRGKQTLGKVLLAGTRANYALPRSKFDVLGFSKVAKGYPEFNPEQHRNPDGTWGHGSVDTLSEAGVQGSVQVRFPGAGVSVTEFRGGYDVAVGDDHNVATFFVSKVGGPLTFEQIKTAEDAAGREFARRALQLVLDAAEASGAPAIRLEAAGAGGYVWPRVGFELDPNTPGGGDAVKHFLASTDLQERVRVARSFLSWGDGRALDKIVREGGLDMPAKLAGLGTVLSMDALTKISGDNRYLSSAKIGKPTLGKALLVGVRGYYALPREKFAVLQRYVNRTVKRASSVVTFEQALKGYPEYRADQPRGPGGRWSGGGGTAPVTDDRAAALLRRNMERDPAITAEEFIAQLPKEQQDFIARSEKKLARAKPTEGPVSKGGFKTEDGKHWIPSRQRVHERIIREVIGEAVERGAYPRDGEAPTIILMGGRGGAGKTTVVKNQLGIDPENDDRFLYLNSDDIKAKLPGFKGWNAGALHEESSHVSDQIERIARDLGMNIIYDATLKSEGSAVQRVNTYDEAGYRIEGVFVHTTPYTSATRAMGRAVHSGRYVPPSYILSSTSNERTFDAVKGRMDKWVLFDNNGSFNPKKIASGGRRRRR